MSHNVTQNQEGAASCLSGQQLRALKQLAGGSTVSAAAASAGVARETVHRWCRSDAAFIASLNAARTDLAEATHRRLAASAAKAADVVDAAVQCGDLKTSLAVLRGLGYLPGFSAAVGPTDVESALDLQAAEARRRRFMRAVSERTL